MTENTNQKEVTRPTIMVGAFFRGPENLEEAQTMMAEIARLREELHADAKRDGDDCFWCCGGGDDRLRALRVREERVVSLFPELEEEISD